MAIFRSILFFSSGKRNALTRGFVSLKNFASLQILSRRDWFKVNRYARYGSMRYCSLNRAISLLPALRSVDDLADLVETLRTPGRPATPS